MRKLSDRVAAGSARLCCRWQSWITVCAVLTSAGVAPAQTSSQPPSAADSATRESSVGVPAALPAPAPPPLTPPPGAIPAYQAPGYYYYSPYPLPTAAPAIDSRPLYLHYSDGEPVPDGYYLQEKRHRGLLISGPLVLGIPYFIGITAAAEYDFSNGSGWLAVPIVGPWVTMSLRKKSCSNNPSTYSYYASNYCGTSDETVRTWLIIDGVAQITGASLFIAGMAITQKRLARRDIVSFVVAPTRVGLGYGLGAFGQF